MWISQSHQPPTRSDDSFSGLSGTATPGATSSFYHWTGYEDKQSKSSSREMC